MENSSLPARPTVNLYAMVIKRLFDPPTLLIIWILCLILILTQ